MVKQPIEIAITQDGIYDIKLPYGCIVLRVDGDKVEVEQVGKQQLIMAPEQIAKMAKEEEKLQKVEIIE